MLRQIPHYPLRQLDVLSSSVAIARYAYEQPLRDVKRVSSFPDRSSLARGSILKTAVNTRRQLELYCHEEN